MNYSNWIIINTSKDVDRAALRPLEIDLGNGGVKALWDDDKKSIEAFAFSPGSFTQESAEAWLAEAKSLAGDTLELESFDTTRSLVAAALHEIYPDTNQDGRYMSIFDIGPNKVVFHYDGKMYSGSYIVVDDTAMIDDIAETTMVKVVPSFERKDTGEMFALESSEPFYAFSSKLSDAKQGDDGLMWKDVLHAGQWFKTNSGRKIQVTEDIIKEAYAAFQAGMPRYVSIPADHHHIETAGVVPVEHNRGFVRDLKLANGHMYAGMDITNAETKRGVEDGSIADCSVYIQPGAFHNSTGQKFDWVLRHVLLTNDPLVNDLSSFGAIPASGSDATETIFLMPTQEAKMPEAQEPQFSDEEIAAMNQLKALNLSADDLTSLADLREREKAIAAQSAELRGQKRSLNIECIVNAMQNKGEHPGVTQIENTAHYPVVAMAVSKILSGLPEALALDAEEDGTTPVDAVVLALVNAIPEGGRVSLSAHEKPRQPKKDPKDLIAELSDEELKAAMEKSGLA